MNINLNKCDRYAKSVLLGLGIAAIFVAIITAISYTRSFSLSVKNQSPNFSISAEGKVIAVPDVAQFSFGVITEGGTNISSLQMRNSDAVSAAIDYLKEQGIADEDIQTQGYNIYPRYQSTFCTSGQICPPSEIVGYAITQDVAVKVRDLDATGTLLAGVVDNGANTVSQLTFTVDEPAELRVEAREKAFDEAKKKAKAIAKAGGFKLGDLISFNESVSGVSPVRFLEGFGGVGGGGAPDIEPGSQEIIVNVTLTYGIE